MLTKKEGNKYVLLGIALLLVIISIFLIKPYIEILCLSAILAFIFHPLYLRITKLIKFKEVGATITTIIILLLIAIPIVFIGYILVKEIMLILNSGYISTLTATITQYIGGTSIAEFIPLIFDEFLKFIADMASTILISIPKQILNILIFIIATYYFLLTGAEIIHKIKVMLPFRNKEEIVSSLQNTIHGLIYGFFGTAIIGFIIALIGLKILGIGSPFLWAAVFGILVLIPSVGSTLCYIPMAIFFFFQGDYFSLIGILILGGILSTVETFGSPYLIGKKTSISPLVIIFGIFGGLVVFGAVGLLIGPIILSITLTLLEEFTTEDEIKNKMD